LCCLAITFYGYAVLNGWVSLSMAETTKRLLLISFVISLALHWDFFSLYVYNFFTNAPNQIASHIISAIPGSLVSDQTSVYNALQQAFYEGIGFGNASWEHGSIPSNCLPYIYAIIIYILSFLIAAISVVELIASKLVMAIYLVLAPIIIPLLLFPATKALVFDGWLRHLVTCALIPIYIMSTIALSLMLMAAPTSNVQSAISSDALTLTNIGGYILCLLVVLFLTLIATHMAVSTAGGASTSLSHRLENLSAKAWNKLTNFKDNNSTKNKEYQLPEKQDSQNYSNQNNNHSHLDPNRSIQNEVNNQYPKQNHVTNKNE
jgi:type IV secretion system protein VirB6